MTDISEPQDLEKVHIRTWFTLGKHLEDYIVLESKVGQTIRCLETIVS